MRDPKELKVFHKADELTKSVYRLTCSFPSEEKFHLVTQIRRAAASVPSNLVEGCSRSSQKDFARFVEIALGSAMELEYQLGLAKELAVMGVLHLQGQGSSMGDSTQLSGNFQGVLSLAAEVVRMLISLGTSLRSGL